MAWDTCDLYIATKVGMIEALVTSSLLYDFEICHMNVESKKRIKKELFDISLCA